jgi:hypothetical protein
MQRSQGRAGSTLTFSGSVIKALVVRSPPFAGIERSTDFGMVAFVFSRDESRDSSDDVTITALADVRLPLCHGFDRQLRRKPRDWHGDAGQLRGMRCEARTI